MGSTITVERLKSRGVVFMQVYHQQIRPGLMNRPFEPAGNLIREDPYAWVVAELAEVWCERRTDGHSSVSRLLIVCRVLFIIS